VLRSSFTLKEQNLKSWVAIDAIACLPENELGQLCKREYAQNISRFTVGVNNIVPNRYSQPIKSVVYTNNCELTKKIILS